jgi:hypothetical protein
MHLLTLGLGLSLVGLAGALGRGHRTVRALRAVLESV